MTEIVKDLIGKLPWILPFVALIVFRGPIAGLMGRIRSVEAGGVKLGADGGSPEIQQVAPQTETQLSLSPVGAVKSEELPSEIADRRLQVRSRGIESLAISKQIESIKGDLEGLQFDPTAIETYELLVRQLATEQIYAACEVLDRHIFGSQFEFLEFLNREGNQTTENAMLYYEEVQAKFPEFFGEYPFISWVGFLFSRSAIAYEDEKYGISFLGSEYLQWATRSRVPRKAY